MTDVQQFWATFRELDPSINENEKYQVWYFGNTQKMALELAELVMAGKKTATASLAAVNKIKPEQAPSLGGYSVVTDFDGKPLCVIQTTEIRHLPFDEVDAHFAADEGEGDLTLEYWRSVHQDYFEREAATFGLNFDDRSLVCCERFMFFFPR